MSILNNKHGKTSSMRTAMLLWTVAILVGWVWVSYVRSELQAIPESVIGLLGLLISGKVVQSFGEKDATNVVTVTK